MIDNNNILQKLDGLEARYEEVSTLITDPDVIADQSRYVKLTKEYKDLGDIMDARRRYINCLTTIKEAKDIIANESDAEMKEMAREELTENEELQPKLEEEIKLLLVPKDPEDAKNVQMEIRGGAGGDEAALFAGDLFNMYKRSVTRRAGSSLSRPFLKALLVVSKRLTLPLKEIMSMVL
jgi:peptide chain release factor 1